MSTNDGIKEESKDSKDTQDEQESIYKAKISQD